MYNTCIKWSENLDGFQEYFSQSFEGALDVGINLLHLYIDYTKDPYSGDLYTDQVAYNNFLIDPYFRKQDLSDCNFIWRRRWVSKDVAKSLMPDRAEDIDKMCPKGAKDGKFPLQAELMNMDLSKLFSYDEFYYKDTREALLIIDTKTQETTEWEDVSDDGMALLESTLYFQPWLETKKVDVPTIKLDIAINDISMYNGPNHLSIDRYPFAPMLCYHEPDMQSYSWKIQGMVRNLRDAQYLYNRRKVIELDILESQINSGWIFPTDAVEDVKAFRQTGQGYLIPLKKGHLPNEVQRINAPDIPGSMLALSESLAEDITKISGVNEELLGSASDDKAGILAMLRQGAGLTTLQTIFDKADFTQRIYGGIRLEAIRKNFTKTKVTQILGYEPPEEFFSSNAQKYSVAVEEGNYTATQRQTELQQLLHFREIGIPIANKSIIEAGFISNKKEVIEDMQMEQEQQAQAQQAQAEQQAKKDNADVMVKYAKARSDLAKEKDLMASATERLSQVEENAAQTEYIKTEKELELIKMMIELEDMDLRQIRDSLELAEKMRGINQQAEGGTPYGKDERLSYVAQ
jgi:hypothetical protein